MLDVGQRAPDFEAPTDDGGRFALSSSRGTIVILYFYPKDNTPGCTQEACDFRDTAAQFEQKGAIVVGISPDSPKSHDTFKSKFALPFTLITDTDKSISSTYGVYVEKKLYGRTYMGINRSTFVIGPAGDIQEIYRGVKLKGHVQTVLAAI